MPVDIHPIALSSFVTRDVGNTHLPFWSMNVTSALASNLNQPVIPSVTLETPYSSEALCRLRLFQRRA